MARKAATAKKENKPKRPGRGSRKGEFGQRGHRPTDESRIKVRQLASRLTPTAMIASMIEISEPTLFKYYKPDLELGRAKTVSAVGGAMVSNAMRGDFRAQRFVMEHFGGAMTEKERRELALKEAAAERELKGGDEVGGVLIAPADMSPQEWVEAQAAADKDKPEPGAEAADA